MLFFPFFTGLFLLKAHVTTIHIKFCFISDISIAHLYKICLHQFIKLFVLDEVEFPFNQLPDLCEARSSLAFSHSAILINALIEQVHLILQVFKSAGLFILDLNRELCKILFNFLVHRLLLLDNLFLFLLQQQGQVLGLWR